MFPIQKNQGILCENTIEFKNKNKNKKTAAIAPFMLILFL